MIKSLHFFKINIPLTLNYYIYIYNWEMEREIMGKELVPIINSQNGLYMILK